MSMGLSVQADDTIVKKIVALQSFGSQFNYRLSQIVRTRALDVVVNAKERVPISTGALRRSIQMDVFAGGFAAVIGSFLPYAARQEFDATLDHRVRPARRRLINTQSGLRGSIIKGTAQTNPKATWGFLRKSLSRVSTYFLDDINRLMRDFGQGFEAA